MDIIKTLLFFFLRILKVQGKNNSPFSVCAEKRANILKKVCADVRLLRT